MDHFAVFLYGNVRSQNVAQFNVNLLNYFESLQRWPY